MQGGRAMGEGGGELRLSPYIYVGLSVCLSLYV